MICDIVGTDVFLFLFVTKLQSFIWLFFCSSVVTTAPTGASNFTFPAVSAEEQEQDQSDASDDAGLSVVAWLSGVLVLVAVTTALLYIGHLLRQQSEQNKKTKEHKKMRQFRLKRLAELDAVTSFHSANTASLPDFGYPQRRRRRRRKSKRSKHKQSQSLNLKQSSEDHLKQVANDQAVKNASAAAATATTANAATTADIVNDDDDGDDDDDDDEYSYVDDDSMISSDVTAPSTPLPKLSVDKTTPTKAAAAASNVSGATPADSKTGNASSNTIYFDVRELAPRS